MNVHLVWRYAPDRREVEGLLVYESGGASKQVQDSSTRYPKHELKPAV